MKLLLDQCVPRTTVEQLSKLGISAEHASELGMFNATDEAILEAARQRGAVVVTLDADFHRILAETKALDPSVVRVRIEGLKGDAMARILAQTIVAAELEILAGAAVSVSRTHLGIRLLPIHT